MAIGLGVGRIYALKFPELRSIVPAFVFIVVVVFAVITSVAPAQASGPTISNAIVLNQKTSLTLPSGGELYIFALATDGSKSTGGFTNSISYLQPPTSVINAAGNRPASIATTTSNTNSYSTSTSSYTIAGASFSGFGSPPGTGGRLTPIVYPGINGAPGANGASAVAYINPKWGDTLVVVVGIAGDGQCVSLSGVPGLITAASNSGSGNPSIIIGYAYSVGGDYQVTVVSSQCAAGPQVPNNAGDLVDVFVFVPTTTTTTTSSK